ncbi:MAG TPA: type VI secretion system membrane subunit TssM [Burkholderiaceae bacterium]|nr:type VI secretion system membrane subunit TssM [Burkholderiaceae bacterium]
MKRVLLAFLNRPLFAVVGVAAAAVLVWFVGPLLTLGAAQPLASEPARWVAIAVLVAGAAAYAVLRAARSARRNRKLIEGLAGGARPRAAPGAQDLAQIGQRFEEAIALLKRTHLGGKRALLGALFGRPFVYQLPWYVIIGAPGAGKTTALVNSGLEFPLAAKLGKNPVRGVGGTRNCDWWFASEAVLIDTAGRFTTQDSDRDADRTAWFGFLDLLVRYRPRRPVNGVLLTVSVTDLLSANAEERRVHARKLRERVDELHARIGAGLPIYVMVTKVDLLAGFMEFFADFDKEERAQVWGVTFPYAPVEAEVDPLARIGAELAALEKRLDDCLFDRLQGEHDRERRAAIYAFPQQWRVLRETLVGFLQSAFLQARGEVRPLVRGVYFTSATQEGTPVDRALGELARALGLKSRIVAPARPSGKTFFVTRLLRDVVFAEAGLAGTNLRRRRSRAVLKWSALGAVCALVLAAVGLEWRSYAANRAVVTALDANLEVLDADVARARASTPTDLVALVPALDALEGIAERGDHAGPDAGKARRIAFDMGLDQSAMLTAAAQDAYQHVLKEVFQRRIAARLEERLRAGRPDNVGLIYEALKAYLMLYGGRNFDAASLRGYLFADWDATLPQTVGPVEREALRRHLDRLLAGGEVGAPARADRALIDKSRALVASVPLQQRIYDRLKSLDPGSGAPAFSIAAAAGPNAAQFFTRTSGLSLAQGIPALYSRSFLEQSLRARSQDVLSQFTQESGWVLGTEQTTPAQKLPPALQADIERLYLADYARTWDGYLDDIHLVKLDSLARTAQVALALGRADSPLVALFTGIEHEVGVLVHPAAATSGGTPTRAIDVSPGAAERFDALAHLVSGQPASMQEVVALLAKLATHLAAVDDAVKRRAAPPPSEVMREIVAFASTMPQPLRGMLAQLATTSAGQVFATRRDDIARQLASEIGPACTRALGARFPLAPTATEEIPRQDFVRVFAAGGLIDGFFQRQLAPYVDTSGATWAFYKPDGSVEPADSLQAFQRAQAIREALFVDGGRTLGTRLELKLLDMDPGVGSLVLDVDGQVLRFTRDTTQPQSVRWPGPNTTGDSSYVQVRMFTNTPGGGEVEPMEGQWALLRLFAHLRSEPGAAPDRVPVTFNVLGRRARFEVKSPTHSNPARLPALEQFQCPQRL